ncbi:MAG: hypothetical protein GY870_11500, partial [archaeon]|nr:hypothetical protein [archaeon]
MQAPTHILTGILIYQIIFLLFPGLHPLISGFIIFILSFFSHFLIDSISKITYHVPDARPEDKFWLRYHIIVYIFTLIFLLIFWNPYWIGILGANSIDIIDWLIFRAILKKKPVFHPKIDKFRDIFFSWLPDMIEKKWTVINE